LYNNLLLVVLSVEALIASASGLLVLESLSGAIIFVIFRLDFHHAAEEGLVFLCLFIYNLCFFIHKLCLFIHN